MRRYNRLMFRISIGDEYRLPIILFSLPLIFSNMIPFFTLLNHVHQGRNNRRAAFAGPWLRRLALLLLGCTGWLPSRAQGGAAAPLLLRDTTQEYSLGRRWDVLAVRHDSVPGLRLDQVRSLAWAGRFRRSREDALNFNNWPGEVWLRTTVVNEATDHTVWLLRGKILRFDTLLVYLVGADGKVRTLCAARPLGFAHNHAVPDRHLNLILPLPARQRVTIYIRADGGMFNFSLCERRQLEVVSYWENLFLSIFLGAMLMLALYNLFLFFSIRERSYLYYVGYVLSFCLLHMNMKGLMDWWFFQYNSEYQIEQQQLLLIGFVMLFGALMARSFLDTRRLVPQLDWLLLAVIWAAPLPLLASHLPLGAWIRLFTQGLPLVANLPLLVVGTAVLRRGYRPARYYMAGWVLVAVANLTFYFAQLKLLPLNELTLNGSALAWILEMVFISLGLADRINLARQAQEQAQSLALRRLREKEEVQQTTNLQLALRATELEHAYEELRTSLATTDHLQELDKVKTNFFTNISHEFRTPLTLILGPAEDLADAGPDPGIRRKGGLILRHAQRLLRLINQLLDLSKLDAGAMLLRPATSNLAALARQVAATCASMAETQGLRFSATGPDQLPWVLDAAKLEMILNTLLGNAFRYTPAGGAVALQWREVPATASAPAAVELLVTDTGPGIAAEQLPWLFDRFYQRAHPTTLGAQPATGVGLALVKALTELHGGTLAVSSPPGQGTTFVVRLPAGLLPAHDEPVGAGQAPAPAAATPAPGNRAMAGVGAHPAPVPKTEEVTPAPEADVVLFIEDNEDVREFIRLSLEPAGYRLLEAPDGLRGVEMALEHVPDLIISDVMMPGLDGYGVVQQLKHHPATSHVPIVLLTAKAAPADRLEGLETGADAYLGKPFAARELRAQIRNLLALRDRTLAVARPQPPAATTGSSADTQAAEAPPVAPLLSAIDRKFMAKVEASVAEHLADSAFDVDQLSSAVALSRTQTQRKLKALTGLAPAEYIRSARLARALVLLQERAGTVAEVGYEVGFTSPAHFSTLFSRQFGYPPSEVAKR